MQVFEISISVKLKEDLPSEHALEQIASFLDKVLCKTGFETLHKSNQYKNYCFNSLYPIEQSQIYQKGNKYSFQIRTIDAGLAGAFSSLILQENSKFFTILNSQIKMIPKHLFDKVYSITPCIMKNDSGYWRRSGNVEDFERRLKENLIKKYNSISGKKMNEDFQLCTSLHFKNKVPISCSLKNVHLLGDKLEIVPDSCKEAQELMYMALGTGILETNARGYGYINYQWL